MRRGRAYFACGARYGDAGEEAEHEVMALILTLPKEARDGLTTKIVALVDALGDLDRFVLLPGQRNSKTNIPCVFAMAYLIKNFFCNFPQAFPPSSTCWNPKPASRKNTLRKMARQTSDPLWGPSSPDFAPIECLNYFRDAGYGST